MDTAPAVAAAGTPGVPQPPVVVFHEDFENTTTTVPLLLTSYVGTDDETYTANQAWLTNCNGMIVNYSMTVRPANCTGGPQGLRALRSMAYALGNLSRAANSATNNALSAYTDTGGDVAVNPGAGLIQLQTKESIPLSGTGKRYLTTAIDVSSVNCPVNAPRLQFSLLSGATVYPVGGEINSCTDPRGRPEVVPNPDSPDATTAVRVGTYTSSGAIPFVGSSVDIRLVNNEGLGLGNDAALDNIVLYDVTPQLDKAFSPTTVTAGQSATLTFTITNTSDLLAKPDWSFTDALPTGMTVTTTPATTTCTNGDVTAVAGGTSVSVSGDLDDQQVSCTVTVHVTAPAGHYVDGKANVTTEGLRPPANTEIDFVPVITLRKSGTLNGSGDNGGPDVGDPVTYTFVVTNPASNGVTLSNVAVNDPRVGPVSCPATPLPAGQSATCTATYTLTQDDIDAGEINNTASATADAPEGVTDPGPATDAAIVPLAPASAITLTKSVQPTIAARAGDEVEYSYLVTNTGNVTLHAISVADTAFSGTGTPPTITCPVTSLAPDVSTTCTATYTVTQADADAGQVTNTAVASGTPPSGPAVTSAPDHITLTIPRSAGLGLTKTAGQPTDANGDGRIDAGDTVSYEFLVTNTGNVTLTNVAIDDPTVGTVTCPTTTIVPNTPVTCTATYTLKQEDLDAGRVDNIATVTANAPEGVTDPGPATDGGFVLLTPAPAITMVKSVQPTTADEAGDEVQYSYVVTNTGNVTLNPVSVADTVFSGTGTPPTVTCPVTSLAPTVSTTCTASYTITQADVDAGQVTNTAIGSGAPPTGPATTSLPDNATVSIDRNAALILTKTALQSADENASGRVDAGDTITFSFLVTNTGNVTLSNITIDDLTVGAVTCPTTPIAPDMSLTCTGTYTLTQDDINNGKVENTATATATAPEGATDPEPDSDSETTPITQAPAITLVKTANRTGLTAGDTVTFTFTTSNTGNVTLTDVRVDETAFHGAGTPSALSCDHAAPVTLQPGEALVCTATYRVAQADVDTGQIGNEATATGTPPSGPDVSDSAGVKIPQTARPALTIRKRASVQDTGIRYEFVVANTGTVTLTGVAVRDPLLAGAGIAVTCPTTPLSPGQAMTCRAEAPYVVTDADVAAGQVRNTAVATGIEPVGDTVTSPPGTLSTPVAAPVLPVTGQPVWRFVAAALLLLVAGTTLLVAAHATRPGRV
ncbi:DUF7507 domain-containing protein [Luedemannella helvata]